MSKDESVATMYLIIVIFLSLGGVIGFILGSKDGGVVGLGLLGFIWVLTFYKMYSVYEK